MTQELLGLDPWDTAAIERRQRELSEWVFDIWKFPGEAAPVKEEGKRLEILRSPTGISPSVPCVPRCAEAFFRVPQWNCPLSPEDMSGPGVGSRGSVVVRGSHGDGVPAHVHLLLGPLYHLTDRIERVQALEEAERVVRPGGVVAAAAISRFASLFDGLVSGFLGNPTFEAIVERDLREGQHRNPTDRVEWFTTAYFHHPEELRSEVEDSGLAVEGLFGIEGPGKLVQDLWDDANRREYVLRVARAIEQEPTLLGLSGHLLIIARKRA